MPNVLNSRVMVRGAMLTIVLLVVGSVISSSGFGDDPKPAAAKPTPVPEAKKPEAKPAAARNETEVREQIEKTLVGEMTKIDFSDTPLAEAMQFIGTLHKINVVLDAKALVEAGVAKDAPISVQLSGISLASAMKIMLEPLGLSYVIDNEVLKITTREVAENHLEIRVYDVRALVDAGYQPKLLSEVIKLKMDGVRWIEADDEGGSVVELPDGLVVSQTQYAHREIAKVLKLIERHAAGKRTSKQPGIGQATVPSTH